MVIKTINDNILNCKENILVQQVNCMGVMGKGLALQIAKKYPIVKKEYLNVFKKILNKKLLLGKVLLTTIDSNKFIGCIFSQYDYKRYNKNIELHTNIAEMQKCLIKIRSYALKNNLTIAIPYGIGCGLGGESWEKVNKMIHEVFENNENIVSYYKID